jgi:2-polyprenyl-6-methoxyphenol hydroxylase-like FAD-dependent oxidoreductase
MVRFMFNERTGVLVVGAGLAGSSAAMFLARRGVDVLLAERHPSTSIHPRATGQNPRTMELLRVGGVDEEIMEISHGRAGGLVIKIVESVHGKVLNTIHRGNTDDGTAALSAAPFGMASQDRVEPILLAQAEKAGADVRFSTEVVSVTQDADGVTARLLDRWTERLTTVRADYVIAADGHRSPLREALGIARHGRGTLAHSVGVIFDADLSEHVDQEAFVLYYLHNPAFTGVYVSTGVPDRHMISFDYHPERGDSVQDFDTERTTELIRIALDDPALDVDIQSVAPWELAARVAERFRDGRVFLAGDAAKVTPPTGGMGGNTAVGDSYDLAWKLADVLTGAAGPALLDSYQAERMPYAEHVVNTSLHLAKERTMRWLDLTGAPEPLDASELTFGFRCRSGAVIAEDDDPAPAEDPTHPSGRPGFRAPHLPVTAGGDEVSTHDLFGNGWVLLTGTDGRAWREAADSVADVLGLRLTAYRLGSELVDLTEALPDTYGIGDAGASLIRPDGVVAWRSGHDSPDAHGTLLAALCRLLDREPPLRAA